MCGITGIFMYQNQSVDRSVLKKMTDSLYHRGPDDEGYYINDSASHADMPKWKSSSGRGNIGLGHRRLSIIDLSTGHQPMTNEDQTIWIVFNGEIYNFLTLKKELLRRGHLFKTNCDTEIIIHAYEEWGQDSVKKLRGMFAFAIWDENKQCLFLARDRVGIKPLYYYTDASKILFGSEIKAILQYPGIERDINVEALYDYISLLYIPAPKTIFQRIFKLLPGYTITIYREGKIVENKYWDLHFQENTSIREDEWCEKIHSKLMEAVSIRLISDVPLGAFLSGGIDSSSVVSLMSSLSHESIKTCSIGFGEQEFNELSYAHQMVRRYGTDHHEMIVHPDAINILDKLSWYYDEPFADSSAIPTYYLSKITRQKVTVALSGDGGDENFAGYRRYYFDLLENRIRNFLPECLRKKVIGSLARVYPKADWMPQILRGKTLLTNLSLEPVEGFYHSMSWFNLAGEGSLLNLDLRRKLHGYNTLEIFRDYYRKAGTTNPLSKVQYLDIKTYLVDDILTKVDRASMANSLEVRVPLLDHEFMELVATIPSIYKLNGKQGKYIFKKSMEPNISREILYRKKMGFSIPLKEWLRQDLRDVFEQSVLSPGAITKTFFDTDVIKKMWKLHLLGLRDYSFNLWTIFMFENWAQKFNIKH